MLELMNILVYHHLPENKLSYYFIMGTCMCTTVHVNGTINLLAFYHEIEHYHYQELWFTYCNTCNNFFIIKS